MMSVPLVRPARPADHLFIHAQAGRLAGVADLPWRSAGEVMRFQQAFMHEVLDAPKPGAVTLVAEGTGEVGGARGECLGFVHAEPMADLFTGKVAAYIPLLAVTPAAEGQGVAQALMAAVEGWARAQGYESLSLDVFASNRRGRAFYARMGYGEESLRLVKDIR
ncbi:GNAT family N-acetyltransferase [Niveispirillum fermenti]|uniref:GNAT family N-acetyltransferase n=1 Tax=Niveispirillum fermenti TaxID=1233113 RepID=UPI003A85B8C5